MKKTFIALAAVATIALFSCKDKAKEAGSEEAKTSETEQKSAETGNAGATNEPKTYKLTFSPDTVYLGKDKEAFVKIKNAKAVAQVNPDGKSEGTELTFDLEVTNKRTVGGNNLFFRTDNFRLTLDNGNSITQDNGTSEGVDAESTKDLKGIVYKIPADAKPKTLNLFHDGTRVGVAVTME
jgi:hypothetical protein